MTGSASSLSEHLPVTTLVEWFYHIPGTCATIEVVCVGQNISDSLDSSTKELL